MSWDNRNRWHAVIAEEISFNSGRDLVWVRIILEVVTKQVAERCGGFEHATIPSWEHLSVLAKNLQVWHYASVEIIS